MRVVEQYGMFTEAGDYMVDRIVRAGLKLAQLNAASNVETWTFIKRELNKLSQSAEFGEATDTVVRDEVFTALFINLPGFDLTQEEYLFS